MHQKIIHNTPILNGLYTKAFLAAIKKYGVPDEEVFQTPDLFEGRNIAQVTLTLYSLARITQKHPDYKGPQMGPKMATENKRNFTGEQYVLFYFFQFIISDKPPRTS